MTSKWTRPSPRRPVRRRRPDSAQPNSQSAPYDLQSVSGLQAYTGLSINVPNPADTTGISYLPDWFVFRTTAQGEDGDYVEINFDNNAGDLDLALYNSNSPSATPIEMSETTGNSERVPLDVPAGEYYIKVYGYEGAGNNDYALTINAPQTKVQADALQPNNTFALATNLDDMSSISNLDSLAVTLGSQEWFRFTLPNTGTSADQVSIDFDQNDGSLQIANGHSSQCTATALEASSLHLSGDQMVSLLGLKAGSIYYVEVSPLPGQTNVANTYNLHVDFAAPTAAPPTTTTPQNGWTIMVYMTVDNLAPYAEQNLIQMQNAAAHLPGNVKIAVLLDQNLSAGDFATGATKHGRARGRQSSSPAPTPRGSRPRSTRTWAWWIPVYPRRSRTSLRGLRLTPPRTTRRSCGITEAACSGRTRTWRTPTLRIRKVTTRSPPPS